MSRNRIWRAAALLLLASMSCGHDKPKIVEPEDSTPNPPTPVTQTPATPRTLTVVGAGVGSGRVVSATSLIDCTITGGRAASTGCIATLPAGSTSFALTASPG